MATRKIIRTGIVGVGSASLRFHLPMLSQLEAFELSAVCDITEARRRFAEKEYKVKTYGNLSQFLADPKIDLVVIATPPSSHHSISIQAMDARKHVIVEKPIALSVREVDEMIAASERNKVFLTVHHNKRWDPDYVAVKNAINTGKIGEVFNIQSRHMIYSSLVTGPASGVPDFDPEWRLREGYGAGALSEWGSHIIDQLLQMVLSKPEIVYGDIHNVVWSKDIDTHFKCLIKFENNLLAEVEVAYMAQYALPSWFALGDKGALIKEKRSPHKDPDPDPLRIRTEKGEFLWEVQPSDRTEFYLNVQAVFEGKDELIVKPNHARMVMQVIDAVRESANYRRSVSLKTCDEKEHYKP